MKVDFNKLIVPLSNETLGLINGWLEGAKLEDFQSTLDSIFNPDDINFITYDVPPQCRVRTGGVELISHKVFALWIVAYLPLNPTLDAQWRLLANHVFRLTEEFLNCKNGRYSEIAHKAKEVFQAWLSLSDVEKN